jgi:hypothetical protein
MGNLLPGQDELAAEDPSAHSNGSSSHVTSTSSIYGTTGAVPQVPTTSCTMEPRWDAVDYKNQGHNMSFFQAGGQAEAVPLPPTMSATPIVSGGWSNVGVKTQTGGVFVRGGTPALKLKSPSPSLMPPATTLQPPMATVPTSAPVPLGNGKMHHLAFPQGRMHTNAPRATRAASLQDSPRPEQAACCVIL